MASVAKLSTAKIANATTANECHTACMWGARMAGYLCRDSLPSFVHDRTSYDAPIKLTDLSLQVKNAAT